MLGDCNSHRIFLAVLPLFTPIKSWRVPALRLLVIAGLLALTITAMGLSSGQMSDLRVAVQPLSRAMNWLEGLDLPFDMDHVAFFSALTFALRVLLPRVRWWWIVLIVVALAAGTELMQFWVPGRTPKLQDARDDLVGGVIGLLAGALLLWSLRMLRGGMLAWRTKPASPAGKA